MFFSLCLSLNSLIFFPRLVHFFHLGLVLNMFLFSFCNRFAWRLCSFWIWSSHCCIIRNFLVSRALFRYVRTVPVRWFPSFIFGDQKLGSTSFKSERPFFWLIFFFSSGLRNYFLLILYFVILESLLVIFFEYTGFFSTNC